MPHLVAILLGLLALVPRARIGLATTFYPAGDPWNPNPYAACLHRDLTDRDLVIAHPTLPCMSRVLLLNLRNRRWVIARVGDRGPRRALVDLAPRTARWLRANGWERVLMVPLDEARQ